MNKATKTLALIDKVMTADQGASYRQYLGKVLPHMHDAYRGKEDVFRSHLGASVIGRECDRALWYGWHWATKPHFDGKTLRLYNTGHISEAKFIAALLTIGVQVYQQDEHGKQFRITDVEGHFGGSGDGVGIGIPDLPPDTPCLLEFKTHNEKSFLSLEKSGVRESKFEHYVQMNIYMRKMGLPVALYGAVNKNTDALYFEIVPLDTSIADQFIDRARKIIYMKQAPSKISESPGWFTCKWCDHVSVCHLCKDPARNCRTCKYSQACDDGNWYCTNSGFERVLTKDEQLAGCSHYEKFKT